MRKITNLNLLIKEVDDRHSQENFRRINQFHESYPFKNFSVLDAQINDAGVDVELFHNLGFLPEDAVVTFSSPNASVVLKHDKFTDKVLVVQSNIVCRVKILVGKF